MVRKVRPLVSPKRVGEHETVHRGQRSLLIATLVSTWDPLGCQKFRGFFCKVSSEAIARVYTHDLRAPHPCLEHKADVSRQHILGRGDRICAQANQGTIQVIPVPSIVIICIGYPDWA